MALGLGRWLRNLLADQWTVRRAFPAHALKAIEDAIGREEARHDGELRFCVEAGLPLSDLWHGLSPQARALELFGRLRVWDTEHNAGVLIYLLLADKHVEIVADRGIHRKVGAAVWESICGNMQREFARGNFQDGVILGIAAVSDLLASHFPPRDDKPNELPNAPFVL